MELKLEHIAKILNSLSEDELDKELIINSHQTLQAKFNIPENLYETKFGLRTRSELKSKGYSYSDINDMKLILQKGGVIILLNN